MSKVNTNQNKNLVTMSIDTIPSVSYNTASINYDKHSKAAAKFSDLSEIIQDYVDINQKDNKEIGGVETLIKSANNVLYDGDKIDIKQQTKSKGFFTLIQAQLNKIAGAEKVATESVDQESNLIELTQAVNEAEIALQQVIQIRDKFVNAFNEITKMAF